MTPSIGSKSFSERVDLLQASPAINQPSQKNSSAHHITFDALMHLLQLASPALPVGAFSYSEGLETLVEQGRVKDVGQLAQWLIQELTYGAVPVEAAVMVRAYDCLKAHNLTQLGQWNQWLSAFRETEELREQSWQMGRGLTRLLLEIQPHMEPQITACGDRCNFAIAFTIAATDWQIDLNSTISGYLHSWVTNLITAGVKLIPLGQTQAQQLLIQLYPTLKATTKTVLTLPDEALQSCGWGLAIASMTHEILYSRLFRS
jgi:urease accessory protein